MTLDNGLSLLGELVTQQCAGRSSEELTVARCQVQRKGYTDNDNYRDPLRGIVFIGFVGHSVHRSHSSIPGILV